MNSLKLKIPLSLLITAFALSVAAQKPRVKNESWYDDKPIHFGFSLGLNAMDFNIVPNQAYLDTNNLYPEVSILNPGINIQIITNFRPSRYFDIRFLPGVSFGQRVIRFYDYETGELVNDEQQLESSFLEFPLLLKYKGERLNNVRPYIIGGLNFRYDLAGKKEYDDEKPVYLRLKRPDLYYEAGAGLDFYLTYFKLSVELKMSTGLANILAGEPHPLYPQYYNAIERMKSQMWILAFHFE
ncbi:MAG: PorT family protein [Bacteroidales bacterium]|nr:PorT family protein [Bacteroidales bacterium]MCU0409161.1 PorT family protein [Bacteroidales bacterium]